MTDKLKLTALIRSHLDNRAELVQCCMKVQEEVVSREDLKRFCQKLGYHLTAGMKIMQMNVESCLNEVEAVAFVIDSVDPNSEDMSKLLKTVRTLAAGVFDGTTISDKSVDALGDIYRDG